MKYYAMIDGEQKGPFELEELPEAGVRPSTYIWCKGLPDWEKAEDNADVCRLFRNHLYDVMHPAPQIPEASQEGNSGEIPLNPSPTRFDYYLKDSSEQIPTLEEIDSRQNKEMPPMSMIGYAWIVTLFCFPPTGIAALVFAYKSRSEWKAGRNEQAHEYCRSAKMWTGITFFLGLIFYAFLFAL